MTDKINEAILIKWLSMYGCLPVVLLNALVGDNNKLILPGVIRRLKQQGTIQSFSVAKDEQFVRLNAHYPLDHKKVDALWVLSKFTDNISSFDHVSAQFPSQIFFLKNNTAGKKQYEIAVFYQDDIGYIRMLDIDDHLNYILVIPSENDIDAYVKQLKQTDMKSNQVLFACVDSKSTSVVPDIRFFKVDYDG